MGAVKVNYGTTALANMLAQRGEYEYFEPKSVPRKYRPPALGRPASPIHGSGCGISGSGGAKNQQATLLIKNYDFNWQ